MKKNRLFRIPLIGKAIAIADDRHGSATRAKFMNGESSFESNLSAKVIRGADYKLADGRIVSAFNLRDYPEAELVGKEIVEGTGHELAVKDYFGSNWLNRLFYKFIYRDGRTVLDLGSGLVTNVAVQAMGAEYNFANPSGVRNTVIALANWHISGTGATAAAATDIILQTISGNGGQTPVAGAQSFISAANSSKYQTVATIAYTGTETVSEWGLITASSVSATTGTPLTAVGSSSATVTGTPLTASSTTVAGQQMYIIRTTTTAVWGLVLSNTTSVITIPAWYKVSDGTAGSTPGSTEAYTLYPVMLDHKVFTGIGVNNGDSIQFTYALTINSGG